MGLKEILDKLGVDTLDESVQAEVKETLSEMIELKAKEKASEMVESALDEEKQSLVDEMETKYEDFTNDMLGKWSDFLDTTIDEEVKLPDNVVEFARLGEMYKPVLDIIRAQLGVESGAIDEEAKAILVEAKNEILTLRDQLNDALVENTELKTDAKTMATQLYIRKKCDGLTESQKLRVYNIIGDLTDKYQIDEKFEFILTNFLNEDSEYDEYDDEDEDENDNDEEKDEKKHKKGKKRKHHEPDDDDFGGPSDDDEDNEKKHKKGKNCKNKGMMEQYLRNYKGIVEK